jgi:hypothetical protein
MAMDSDALGLKWANVIINASATPPTPDMITNMQKFWKDMAKEAVTHIQDNAEVPAGISVSTTGSATSQAGKTTDAGKVT